LLLHVITGYLLRVKLKLFGINLASTIGKCTLVYTCVCMMCVFITRLDVEVVVKWKTTVMPHHHPVPWSHYDVTRDSHTSGELTAINEVQEYAQ
jgi:hypothetical protein